MRAAVVIAVLLAGLVAAQTALGPLVPVWLGTHYSWVRLGPGLVLNGDVLSAQAPRRIYGVQISYKRSPFVGVPIGPVYPHRRAGGRLLSKQHSPTTTEGGLKCVL